MACQIMHFWTLSGLVGAFLDLAIAYLLLCASTIAFLASKFLGFFGLCLPCPCNGLFGNTNENFCLQRLLVDCPIQTVSSVQLSVKSKFPFDSILETGQNCHLDVKLIGEGSSNVDRLVELEGETSSSSISDARKSQNGVGRDLVRRNENGVEFGVMRSPGEKEGRFDFKGKGILIQRARGGARRRRKGGVNYGKFSSGSSYDPPCADVEDVPWSPPSISEEGDETIKRISLPVDSGLAHHFNYDGEAPIIMRLEERVLHDFEMNESLDENKSMEKKVSSIEDLRGNALRQLECDGDEKNTIRVLEQALEEEQAARCALYLELEKERSAAGTAADEAMAMILRIQEEKASIEMEARQYQSIIEAKSAYDAEEMNILKEILLRREREKHFLEKEVEAYRQTIYPGYEQLEGDVRDMVNTQRQQPLDLSEDPVLMLHRLSESIDKKIMVEKTDPNDQATSIDKQNGTIAFGKELPIQEWNEDANFPKQEDLKKQNWNISTYSNDGNHDLQRKEMVPMSSEPREGQRLGKYPKEYNLNNIQEHSLLEKTIRLVSGEQEPSNSANLCQEMAVKTSEIHSNTEICIPHNGLEQHGKDAYHGSRVSCNLMSDKEQVVHDVHVIGDESNLCNEFSGNKSQQFSVHDISQVNRTSVIQSEASAIHQTDMMRDCPSTSRLDTESGSSSDMSSGLPPMGLWGRSFHSNMRRNSLSALDNERLKIDSEVGLLRERLRIVQEGREKLNLSVEHREMELQLLEDIARQLREIRQLTEPKKVLRPSSLPPPSKVLSKKRRGRSVALVAQKSF